MDEIRILGAGISGLSAAINLRKLGRDVVVYEQKGRVSSPHEDMQGIAGVVDPAQYLKSLNIDIKPKGRGFPNITFCTPKREIDLKARQVGQLVIRGGDNSIEHDMYEYADKLGVRFEFNAKKKESDADIIATGRKRCDALAVGMIFENSTFDRDRMLVMFDDKYSPKGCYLYVIPISKDRVEIINCALSPYSTVLRKLTLKAIEEKKFLSDITGGKEPLSYFGCTANFDIPRTAITDGRMYVGEAAGFQDASVGTGIKYALESGKLAAEAIANNTSYDEGWKRAFLKELKSSAARRFLMSTLGDKLFEFMMKKYQDGDYLDVDNTIQNEFAPIESILYRVASVKHFFTGRWC